MRLKEFQKRLRKEDIDVAIFIAPDPNIFYFSQIDMLSFACLVVPSSREPLLITSMLDYERSSKEFRTVKNVITLKSKRLTEFLADYFKRKKVKVIGINKTSMNLYIFSRLRKKLKGRFVDVSGICSEIRAEKTYKEINYLRHAAKITDEVLGEVFDNFNVFKTENDVEAELNYLAKQRFADRSFKAIVASGRNSSMPHHMTKNRPLQKGFCLIDFGVKYRGYCSDITRTVFIGKPTKKEQRIYDLVRKVQEDSIKKVKEGIKCSELFDKAKEGFGKHKDKFIHGLGHGVGIEIHEAPNLSNLSKDVLKKGMVFTIEPGIYFANMFGVRIEDMVYLGKRKTLLTRTPKGLRRV